MRRLWRQMNFVAGEQTRYGGMSRFPLAGSVSQLSDRGIPTSNGRDTGEQSRNGLARDRRSRVSKYTEHPLNLFSVTEGEEGAWEGTRGGYSGKFSGWYMCLAGLTP